MFVCAWVCLCMGLFVCVFINVYRFVCTWFVCVEVLVCRFVCVGCMLVGLFVSIFV